MQKATGHIRPRKRKDGQKAFQIIAELPPDPLTGKRDLIVPAHLMKMLRSKYSWYLQQRLLYGGDFTDSNLVICQPNGKPYHPDHFAKKFRKLLSSFCL